MFIWTIGDVIGVFFLLCFALMFLVFGGIRTIKMWRCKHDGRVYETGDCSAICEKCGANLGFIGTWRERQSAADRSEK